METGNLRATFTLLLALTGCQPLEYSPYQVPGSSETATITTENVARISNLPKPTGADSFSFAVIADTHTAYDELNMSIRAINADTSLLFLVVAGDITQFGLQKEYDWFLDILSHLRVPYVSVIGNHDALANGATVYERRLGALNYSFNFRGIKFVCINDNIWEFPFAVPDFSWLEGELATASAGQKLFVVSHIPPTGDQFDAPNKQRFVDLLGRYHVSLSIHGHAHNFSYHISPYLDGVDYLISDNIAKRNYVKVTVTPNGHLIERVFF